MIVRIFTRFHFRTLFMAFSDVAPKSTHMVSTGSAARLQSEGSHLQAPVRGKENAKKPYPH